MSTIFYILCVATLNLALGYALALKVGPPAALLGGRRRRSPAPREGASLGQAPPASQYTIPPLTLPTPAPTATPAAPPLNLAPAETAAESAEATRDDAVPQAPAASAPPAAEPPQREKGPVEASVEDFMAGLQQFRDQIAQLDRRVRDCRESDDAVQLQGCVDALREASDGYVKQTRQTSSKLEASEADLGDTATVSHRVRVAVQQQTEQVEVTRQGLGELDLTNDVGQNCQWLLDETTGLVGGATQLQQELQDARAEIAQREGWFGEQDLDLLTDDRTQVATRAALEAEMLSPRAGDSNKKTFVSLLDIDHCTRINQEQGFATCDNVLRAVAQVLSSAASSDSLVSCFGGQRYGVLFRVSSSDEAVAELEQMRQQLEATVFEHDGEPLRVTASCALAAVQEGDTRQAVFDRLSVAIAESKQHGRNRTFLHEGENVLPVSALEIEVQGTRFEV